MKVAFTHAARADITAIGRYILEHNPARATTFLDELRLCCLEIGETPEAFAGLPLPQHKGMRRRVFGRYLIFYRIEPAAIVIVRVLHGARNLDRALARHRKAVKDPSPD